MVTNRISMSYSKIYRFFNYWCTDWCTGRAFWCILVHGGARRGAYWCIGRCILVHIGALLVHEGVYIYIPKVYRYISTYAVNHHALKQERFGSQKREVEYVFQIAKFTSESDFLTLEKPFTTV